MKLALLGVGQAGGKLVDACLAYDERAGTEVVRSALAVNTAATDLQGLRRLPEANRLLVGRSRVSGHGVGADNELAAEIARDELDEITGALDAVPASEIDAFLVIAALGGGTGSGAGPVIIRRLQELYTEPVYALGVLPTAEEGGIYAMNAARSLRTYVREADSLLLFDNDAFRESAASVEGGYDALNEALATRLGVLFSAGEVAGGAAVGQTVVDASEVINTLAGGGLASVGYSAAAVEPEAADGLLARFSEDGPSVEDDVGTERRVASLVRQATLGQLTLPCDVRSIERALVVVAGPPEHLSRRGVERARSWVEDETGCMEVRGGDYPLPGARSVAAAVLLAGVTDAPRIERLQAQGVEAKEAMEESAAAHESGMTDMLDDGLDPLF